jgi:hypothetical protein
MLDMHIGIKMRMVNIITHIMEPNLLLLTYGLNIRSHFGIYIVIIYYFVLVLLNDIKIQFFYNECELWFNDD